MTRRAYTIKEHWFDSPLGEIAAYYVADNFGHEYGVERYMNKERAELLQTELYELEALLENQQDKQEQYRNYNS